jgi:outer membrane protein insertion porin family
VGEALLRRAPALLAVALLGAARALAQSTVPPPEAVAAPTATPVATPAPVATPVATATATPPLVTAAAELAPSGPPIHGVNLLSDAPIERPAEAMELVTLRPGVPYDEQEARRTLRNLRASGLAAEAEVWTRSAADGTVDVDVAIWTNVFIDKVDIVGTDTGIDRDALRREVEVAEGTPLLEDRVLRSVYRLQDRYRGEGYFEASVRTRVRTDEARRRASVDFLVVAGPRAHIGKVDVAGSVGPFSDPQLIAAMKARPGQAYRQSTVRDDADRLRKWFHEQGYRQAEVELRSERYDPATHLVALDYEVDAHGRLFLQITGADEKELKKHDLLPFLGDEGYDDAVVLLALDRIKRWYQERGYYHVQVERQEERKGQDIHLKLAIQPGAVYTLRDVRFRGNQEVPASKLAELMTTAERKLLVAGSGRLVDEVLAADLENVRAYYALSGWTQAKVGPAEVGEEGQSLLLTVPVVEGPRSRVVDLVLEGVRSIDEKALRRELPLQPSGPFHPRLLEEALDTVRSRYEQEGYPFAQVSATSDWNPDHTLVNVTLRVLEGSRQTAASLIVRGNRDTDTDVVRELAGITPGEPLSRKRLLDVQRNLYRLGIFSRVDVSLPPSGDSVRERDVLVELEEGKTRRVAYGVGYDSEEGIGGLVSYSQANLLGRALHFQADARVTQRTQHFRLLLTQPYWGSARQEGAITYLLFQEEERRLTFFSQQRGARIELSRGFGRWRFSLFGDYRNVDLAPGDETLDISSLPPDEQRALTTVRILSLTPRVVWDDRDDPIEPHRGNQFSATFKYAFPAGAIADQHFVEVYSQLVHLWDLHRVGVLAASARGGAIEQLGSEPVAISELFFAGGRTTHRAFDRDTLGIEGQTLIDGEPIGGRGLLLLNLDWRFPIAGALGGTLFADAGNVWLDWRDVRWQEVRPGVGAGLRYVTPLGPLRVDVGWKLDQKPGEPKSVVLLSFGNAF